MTDPAEAHHAPPKRRWRLRISAWTAIVGAAVLGATITFLAMITAEVWITKRDLESDTLRRAERALDATVQRTRAFLDPAYEGNRFIAQLVTRGEVNPRERERLVEFMIGAMAATPQTLTMGFIDTNFEVVRVNRSVDEFGIRISDWSRDRETQSVMAAAANETGTRWAEPFWSEPSRSSMLNLRSSVHRDGKLVGVLVSAVSLSGLSESLAAQRLATGNVVPFVLRGTSEVLAHHALAARSLTLSDRQPLPRVATLGDATLVSMAATLAKHPPGATAGAAPLMINAGGDRMALLARRFDGYGPVPLLVGVYMNIDAEFRATRDRWVMLFAAGCLGLALTLLIAGWAAGAVRRPLRRLTTALHAPDRGASRRRAAMPKSRLREIDDAIHAVSHALARERLHARDEQVRAAQPDPSPDTGAAPKSAAE